MPRAYHTELQRATFAACPGLGIWEVASLDGRRAGA